MIYNLYSAKSLYWQFVNFSAMSDKQLARFGLLNAIVGGGGDGYYGCDD